MADEPKGETATQLKQFIEALQRIDAAHPDCVLSINGETVSQWSITMINPIASFGEGFGLREVARDPARKSLIDVSVNGREHPRLPDVSYPFARPRDRSQA